MALKNYFFPLSVFLIFGVAHAQFPPTVEWSKVYGGINIDMPSAIRHTTDGGYIVSGNTGSINGDISGPQIGAWIVKLDANGNMLWEESYGGTFANDIQQTSDGGYIVTGEGVAVSDFWVFKLNANGSLIWQATYGGSEVDRGHAIQQTADGGYIATGWTGSNDGDVANPLGNQDVWVLKFHANGALDWKKTYGGSQDDIAVGIQQSTDGGYVVAAKTQSHNGDVGDNSGQTDLWVFKIDGDGDMLWEETYGGSGHENYSGTDHMNDVVQQTNDGGYIVTGYTNSSDGDVGQNQGASDIWVLKLNANGTLDWEKTYGGTSVDYGGSIQQTLDGNYIVGGTTYSNNGDVSGSPGIISFWFFKIDPVGNILWEQAYGGSNQDFLMDVQQVSGCEYVLTGFARSDDGDVGPNNVDDFFVDLYWIVKVQIDLEPPTAPDPQSFCWRENPVIDSLEVHPADTLGFPVTINWYDNKSDVYTLPGNTPLLDGEKYYVVQVIDGCESPMDSVVVHVSNPIPMAVSPQDFCVDDNLSLQDVSIIGQNLVWYADSTEQNQLPNNTPLQDGETYYVTQTLNNCESSLLPIAVVVNPLPNAFPPPPYVLCDTGNDGEEEFHLPDVDNAITGGASGVTVSYHKTLPEAENGTTSLPDDYTNEQSPSQSIFARVEDDVTECFDIVEVVLEVVPVPGIAGVEDLYGCGDGNGEAVFDLTQNNENVLGNQNPNNFSITYHESQPDANTGNNAIPNPENHTSGPKPVFVRLESTGTDCYDTGSFALFINPRPNIDDTPIALEVCSDEEGGNTAIVDLTQFNNQINPGSPANTMVVYYANANDHQNGNSISNPESYVVANNQTLLAETIDGQTGCASLTQTQITIRVNDRPMVDLGGSRTICWDSNLSTPGEGGNYEAIVLETGLDENQYVFEWALNGEALPETSPSLEATEPGEYAVMVSDTDGVTTTCTSTARVTVNEANPPEFSLSRVSGAVGSSHSILVSEVSGVGNFTFRLDNGEWLPLNANGTLVFEDVPPGTHRVYGRSLEGCSTTVHTITLIGYPKFFTPNSDGQNDRWNIIGLEKGKVYVFDRYGKLLASLKPSGRGWDGNYNGKAMPSDDYWFKVEFLETLPDGTEKAGEFAANFSLIR